MCFEFKVQAQATLMSTLALWPPFMIKHVGIKKTINKNAAGNFFHLAMNFQVMRQHLWKTFLKPACMTANYTFD